MKCLFREAITQDGECEYEYPTCLKKIGICVYEEKYRDLLMDTYPILRVLEEEGKDEILDV